MSDTAEGARVPVLVQYYQVARRWKWVIAGILIGALVMAAIATLLMTPRFLATSRIEISREQMNVTEVEGVESEDAGKTLEFYQTQYALLRARSLAERVARQLNLANNPEFLEAAGISFEGDGSLLGSPAANSLNERSVRENVAVNVLLGNISISPIRGSALVDISFSSTSPELAARIANAWTQEFIEASIDRRFGSTNDARQFLEQQLAELRVKLEASERNAVTYATQEGIVSLSRSQNQEGLTQSERTLATADLEFLSEALNTATAGRIEAESRLRNTGANGANTEALSNPTITELRQRRGEVAAEYARLLVQFEPEYPGAAALREQISALDASITREETRVANARSATYREALQNENQLRARVNNLRDNYNNEQRANIQYNIFQRDADTNRQLYDALLQRYKEIGVAGVSANNIAVVDRAEVPNFPSSPNLMINMMIALALGLIVATLATIALDQIDEGLREPGQVSRDLNVPLLGTVPAVKEEALPSLMDPKSVLSEAYFSVRSSLAFSTDHGVPKSMMVTSTRPSEGKSTTSLALATVIGRTGKKVLLLDGDMRSPSIHEFVDMPNGHGLSNFLSGEDDWNTLARPTSVRGVWILSAGPTPPSAAELLSSERMMLLLRELGKQFDHIIVDSPPILGLADAPMIARAVEGCVFVAEAEGVAVRGIRESLGRLGAAQAHVFGVVLTKFNAVKAGYGYGYGYGYGSNGARAEASA